MKNKNKMKLIINKNIFKKQKGKIMLFYKDTGETRTPQNIQEPDKDEYYYLISEFEPLFDFDFKNFNYFLFEQEVTDDMTIREFNWWFESNFKNWLQKLDEFYIDIAYEDIIARFNSDEEKRIFLTKLVHFVMFMLPYEILKKIFKEYEITNSSELETFINDDLNLFKLRGDIITQIHTNEMQFEDFVKILNHFEKIAKKNLVEDNIKLVEDHVQKNNLFFEIFKEIIKQTDMEKFREYIRQIIKTDPDNIF